MAYKQGQESHSNCMDGVRVKISERYKPPPRINLAMTYSQRLHLNKQLQDGMPRYDFSLEASIKERMHEWKGARNAAAQDRRANLERVHRDHEKRLEEKLKEEKSAVNENDVNQVLIPTQVSTNNFANILTPIPLSTQTTVMQPVENSPINISDFEQDTCSPFDNMELKTINDMEELKLVLQNDDKKRSNYLGTNVSTHLNPYTSQESDMKFYNYNLGQTSSQSFPGNPVYTTTNGYSYYQAETLHPNMNSFLSTYNNAKTSYEDNTLKPSKMPFKSVTDIMKALHTDLNNVRIDPNESKVKEGVGGRISRSPDPKLDNLENPFDQLSKHLQDLCNAIVSMGFPLPRVARACKNIGDDQKKIIDHMIAMSDLLDLGFKEENVSAALLECNNDRDEALEKLIL